MTGRRAAIVLAGLLLTGCAAAGTASPGDPTPSPSGRPDPLALVGMWRVEGAAGEEPGAVLRLTGDRQLDLWRACGPLMGSWRAERDGLFAAYVFGWIGTCKLPTRDDNTPDWLRTATGHRADGDARVLLDERGEAVARLLPGGRVRPHPNIAESETEPPVVTPEVREAFRPAAALPADLRPADRAAVVGRWVPADGAGAQAPEPPFVELRADGSWSGSDGCNAVAGRWVAGPGGALLVLAGGSTLIGCDGSDAAHALDRATRAGLDGELLVIVDRGGAELARLKPAR